jgi:glycosyltransferase involved in cell wall biosynthesis
MRILTVHNFYQQPGGEDVVWRNEAALLRSKGHRVCEYVRHNSEIGGQSAWEGAKLGLRTIWSRETAPELSRILCREKPQVVHFHNTFPLISPSAYYVCRDFGVPVVQTLHNYRLVCPAATFFREGKVCEECAERGLWRSIVNACYRGSRSATAATAAMLTVHRTLKTWSDMVDCFVVPAGFCREKLIQGGIPRRKIFVKPNFLPSDPGRRETAGDYALFVGRFSPEKGLATLIAAWRALSTPLPIRILGDGPLRSQLEVAAAPLGPDRVRFEGWASREAVIAAIKGARFLIFPSEWYETFGLAAVEAFACGVPVIASRLGVMAELVKDGWTGLHFTARAPDDLAAKVEWAQSHPAEMERIGRNARAEYQSKYTSEINYGLLMNIYSSALGNSRELTSATEKIA